MRRTGQTLVLLCVLALVGGVAGAQMLFDGCDLGLPEGWTCGMTQAPYAVNNAGLVAGAAVSPEGTRALVWHAPGDWEVLPGLDGRPGASADDINEAGWVVGRAWIPLGTQYASRAVLWRPAPDPGAWTITKLDVLDPDTNSVIPDYDPDDPQYPCLFDSRAPAVSEGDGDVVHVVGWGEVVLEGGTVEGWACRWDIADDGTVQFAKLGTGAARDVNDYGQACGAGSLPGGALAGWALWGAEPTWLNGLGGTLVGASGINNAGTVVGGSTTSKGYGRACLWSANTVDPVDLGAIGGAHKCSWAQAINSSGQIVGSSSLPDVGRPSPSDELDYHATLWSNGQVINLTAALTAPLGVTLRSAMDINDNAWIVGYMGEYPYRPFLLVPAGSGPQPPVADAGGPYSGQVGSPITLDGSGSYDPDGDILSFLWDFGDGSPMLDSWPEATVTHAYAAAGTYTVTLTVSDDDGAEDSDTTTATVTDGSGEPGGIAGTVTDANGPVKKAIVTAYDGAGYPAATGKTLPSGAYTITGLAPGDYTVKAELGDLEGWAQGIVTVLSGQTTAGVDIIIAVP